MEFEDYLEGQEEGEDSDLQAFLCHLLDSSPQNPATLDKEILCDQSDYQRSTQSSVIEKTSVVKIENDDESEVARSCAAAVNFAPQNFSGIYSQYKNQSLNAPVHYPNLLAIALNSHEPSSVAEFFHYTCTPNVRIFRMEYTYSKFLATNQPPELIEFTKDQYIRYYHGLTLHSPDSTCFVHSHRVCYEEECSIYICMGKYDGTLLQLSSTNAATDTCVAGKPFSAVGSVALFRNKNGKIFRIEFYIDYSK